MYSRVALASLCLSVFAGCSLGGLGSDPKQDADEMIEETWLDENQDKKLPAVEFFEKGGKHYEIQGRGTASNVDRDLVLPLVKRLRDEFKAEPYALVPLEEDYCWEIIVKLPPGTGALSNTGARSGIAQAIAETDGKFAGEIAFDWGHKWLAFNFQDPEDSAGN